MIFGYDATQAGLARRGILVAVSVVALPLAFQLHTGSQHSQEPAKSKDDPRVAVVHGFFRKLNCPIADLAPDFVRVADQNHLDWRLLPSIAVVESGGGKAYRHNNVFGWNGGDQEFSSIKSGLELVGYKLGKSRLYRQCSSLEKLRIYNEDQDYAPMVMHVMKRLSPVASLN